MKNVFGRFHICVQILVLLASDVGESGLASAPQPDSLPTLRLPVTHFLVASLNRLCASIRKDMVVALTYFHFVSFATAINFFLS